MREDESIGSAITVEALSQNPYPLFKAMLANEPICWVPNLNMWMVTRYADVQAILKDAELFTMEPSDAQTNPMEALFGPMMLSIDGPPHKRVRDVFMEPFRPRHVRQWYIDSIHDIANRLIDELLGKSGDDLDATFSDKLAIYTVVMSLGFEVDDDTDFREWYDAFGASIGNAYNDPDIAKRGEHAFNLFQETILNEVKRLRSAPNRSVLSEIVHSPTARLTDEEIVSNAALTFFGGVETTSAMISNAIWALLSHPAQFEQAKSDDALLKNGIEEAIRWEAPVQGAMRFPTRPVTIQGVEIGAGEKIYCMLGAANRDPQVFTDPDRFDIARENANKHLCFAYGPHFCFGAPLARVETQIGLELLFKRLPNLRLNQDRLTRPTGHEFRSPQSLYCKWG